MDVRVKVTGADTVGRYVGSIPGTIQKRFLEAMRISLRDIQEQARAKHRFTTRTGDAERSIEASEVHTNNHTVRGEVGTTRLITIYLHQGTKPHNIMPRNKRVLRWADGGGFVFARRVKHPGTKKDPFIFDAADAQEAAIVSRFDKIIASL